MLNITIAVIIYSSRPKECKTLASLLNVDFFNMGINPHIVVWDNSKNGYGDEIYSLFNGLLSFEYVHTPENTPLAKVYNIIFDKYLSTEWICLFDDDSFVDYKYFHSFLSELIISDSKIGIPLVFNGLTLVSPGERNRIKGRSINRNNLQLGVQKSRNTLALMSGVVIHSSVYLSNIRFDERLMFYGVDTKFFIDAQKHGFDLFVMSAKLDHCSWLDNDIGLKKIDDSILWRFENLVNSWPITFGDSIINKLILFIYIPLFVVKKSYEFRSLRLLNILKQFYFIRK